ncbi:MAG: hypothetical protein MPN21_13005 [Thermoanaerobaculia bacterium]|nr:hypothetical protein [Thermoanaerobaculia bacterium]
MNFIYPWFAGPRSSRARSRFGCFVLLLLLPWQFASVAVAQEGGPINEMCPVLTDQGVEEGLSAHFGSVEVGFCCELCREQFLKNPEPYLAALSPEAAAAVRQSTETAEPAFEFDVAEHLDLVTLVVLLLLALLAWRRDSATSRRAAVVLVMMAMVALAAFSWWRAEGARSELQEAQQELQLARWKELIHNNTYYDYGNPPRPLRPPVEPRLQATFYRGNDERSDNLFNGGNYLTSYFDLSIVDAAGDPIEAGEDVSGRELALRFQIRRGPNTPDFFWSDDIMGHIFLTGDSDPFLGYESPVADRRDLTTVEPMSRWHALYPLGAVQGGGEERLDEVVYVAEAWFEKDRMIGATFHYGIEVVLRLLDGTVAEDSEVYMGALFRPRKSPFSRVPPEEWLSHEPLPELPEPQGDDPETLGIVDYLDGV